MSRQRSHAKGSDRTETISRPESRETQKHPEKIRHRPVTEKQDIADRLHGKTEKKKEFFPQEHTRTDRQKEPEATIKKTDLDRKTSRNEGERPELGQHREKLESRQVTEKQAIKERLQKKIGQERDYFSRETDVPSHNSQKRKNEQEKLDQSRARLIENIVKKNTQLSEVTKGADTQDIHFLNKKEFAQEIKKREPEISNEAIEGTAGFHDPRDRQVYIKDTGSTLSTGIHEELHHKSHNDLPRSLNEGVTEYFAQEKGGVIGRLKTFDTQGKELLQPDYYKEEVAIVRKLDGLVGREPLKKAYFENRADILEQHIDKSCGKGSFDKLLNAMENKQFDKADKIIKKGANRPKNLY